MNYILRTIFPNPSRATTYTVSSKPEDLIDQAERAVGCQCMIAKTTETRFRTSEEIVQAYRDAEKAGNLVHVKGAR